MGTILAEFDEVGYAQGLREEGQIYKLIEMICKKLRKNKTPQQIADELEEELQEVEHICKLAARFAPDYDVDKVFYEWAIKG